MSSVKRARRRERGRAGRQGRVWLLTAAGAGLLVPALRAHAANTWDGGGTTNNWNDALNWDDDLVPTFPAALTFTGVTRLTPSNNIAGLTVNSITFDPGADAFTIGGNGITLGATNLGVSTVTGVGSGIFHTSASNEIVNLPLALSTGRHYFNTAAGTGSLTLGGAITRPQAGSNAAFLVSGGAVNTTLANDATGIIGGWATVSSAVGNSWAANDGAGNIVPFGVAGGVGAFSHTFGAAGTVTGTTATSNVDFTGGGALTISAGTLMNTFRISEPLATARTMTLQGTLTFTDGGGILKSADTAAVQHVMTAGSITAGTAGAATLYIRNRSTSSNPVTPAGPPESLNIASPITNNAGAGAVTVVKSGYGVLRLQGNSSYSGGTYANEGQLRAETNNNALGTGPVYVAADAQLFLGSAVTLANNLFIAGLGPNEGAFRGGAVRLNTANSALTGTVTLVGDARIGARNNAGVGTISGQITGGFALEFNNNGNGTVATIVLSNTTNNWTGATTLSSGVVRVGVNEVIPHGGAAGNVIINGDTVGGNANSILDLNGKTETINGLSTYDGVNPIGNLAKAFVQNNLNATVGTLIVGSNNASANYGGTIRDNGGGAATGTLTLTKTGSGVQTLSGTSTYTGGTNVQGGTLRVGADTALPATGTLTLGTGAASGTLDLGGFNPTVGGLAVSGTGTANVIGNSSTSSFSTLNYVTGTTTFAGVIQNTVGAGSLTTALTVGSGSLTLSGANTFTGGAAVNGGTLSITGSLAAANAATVNAGGTLIGTGNAGGVTVSGGTLRAGTAPADVATLTVASLSFPTGNLTVDLGASFTADLIHDLGNLTIGDGSSPLALTVSNTSSPAVGNYLVMDYGGTLTKNSDFSITGPSGFAYALNYATAGKVFLNVSIPLVTLTWNGAADLTSWDFSHVNFNNGTTNVAYSDGLPVVFNDTAPANATTISIPATVAPFGVTVNSSTRSYTFTGAGDITGNIALTKSGSSTLTVANDNTYLGGTTISGGTIQVGNGGTTGSLGTGAIVDNGALAFNRADTVTLLNSVSGSGSLTQAGAGTLILAAANSYGSTLVSAGTLQVGDGATAGTLGTGAVTNNATLAFSRTDTVLIANTITNTGTINVYNTGDTTFSGGITLSGAPSTIVVQGGGPVAFSGNITGAGSLQVLAGTVTLSGTNSYGATSIQFLATLRVGNGGTTGTLGTGPLTNDGTLVFNRSDALAINGAIGNTGNVQQAGSGTTTFNAAHTYSGSTIITGGTLVLAATGALGDGSATNNVIFGNGTAGNVATGTGTLDLTSKNVTIPALIANSNSANNNTILLGAGKTLTVSGDVTIGGLTAPGTGDNPISNLVVTGATSTLHVGAGGGGLFLVSNQKNNNSGGGDTINAKLDLSALGTFVLDYGPIGTVGIGAGAAGTGGNAPFGTLILGGNNTITAAALNVGLNNGGGNTSKSFLLLGTTNVINVDHVAVGAGKTQPTTFDPGSPNPTGTMRFNTGLVSPTVKFRAADGTSRVLDFTVVNGDLYTGGSGTNESGIVDLTGGSVDALIDNLLVAVGSNNGNTGAATFGILSVSAGTVDATTVVAGIEDRVGGVTNAAVTGTINVSGTASFVVGATGIELGHRPTATSAITGVLNIAGGTVTVGGDIFSGGGTATVTLNGGLLNMAGHNLGTATGLITNANLQAGTLRNVAQFNDGTALTKTTAGTLTIDGASTFTGDINNNGAGGTLNLAGVQTHPATASLNANAGTTNVQSNPGSTSAYTLAVNVTPATGSSTLHFASNTGDAIHIRDLHVNPVATDGAGLVIIDAAANGSAPNPIGHFGAIGGSVAVYLGDGAGSFGLPLRATLENIWKSVKSEGYWALQNAVVTVITRGVTLAPGVVTNTAKNGLVLLPSFDNAGHAVVYLGEDIQGDANGDGAVDIGDLGIVLQHINSTPGTISGETGYTIYTTGEGDMNGDGAVDIGDLGIVLGNSGQTYTPTLSGSGVTPVPEPASVALLALGGAALLRRRRGRR